MRHHHDIDLGRGRSLHAVSEGEGPDLVLLHGAIATVHDWLEGPFDRLVAAGFRVTAVDRPGHGRSRRPRFEGGPRDQARQIRAGLDAIGIVGAGFVSHSFGGLVSLAMAELFPDSVSHLVLVAPLAFPEWRTLEHALMAPRALPMVGPLFSGFAEATFDRPMLEAVQRLMFSPQPVDPAWKASYPYAEILDRDAMVAEGEDTASILPLSPAGTLNVAAIRTPSRILTGTSDKVVEDERQGKMLARLLPNARLTEVGGVGHMLHHARPDLVVEAALEMAALPA